MRWSLSLVLSAACTGAPGYTPPDYGTETTDTIPQFYGWVPHNILMLSLDTFRKDHLDRYGDVGATPFLTSLAEQGFALDDHVQCSDWTYASTSCTLAGRYNEDAGMIPQLVANFDGVWPVGTPFLASYLDELGVYGVMSSTNGWLGPEWGNTQGNKAAFHPSNGSAYGAYLQGREALDAARELGIADRWMLHVHATEPHAAYDPPDEYLGALDDLPPDPWGLANRDQHYAMRDSWPTLSEGDQSLLNSLLQARYEGELQWLDDQVFWIIRDMDIDGLLDDTLVIVWTDHGEQFWEHGYQTHAWTQYREETDGILLFWSKNIVPGSWSGPTHAVDLVPTVMNLYGLDLPATLNGYPVGQAPDDRPQMSFAIARRGPESAITQGGHKLIYTWSTGALREFDLTADPGEQIDLYDSAAPSEEAQALWAVLQPQVAIQHAVEPDYALTPPAGL